MGKLIADTLWQCRDVCFDLAQRGEIMGILNVTPDSFSDGGQFSALDAALDQAGAMIDQGAAIIDVGGESTRPGADDVSVEEEISRTIPVIAALKSQYPEVCISIDTSKTDVARQAIEAGADIVNDVTGFQNREMIEVVAETGVGAIAMHMKGTPRSMQKAPVYKDVVTEVRTFFEERWEKMTGGGIDPRAIVFDPGIGFGKQLGHNLELLRRLDELSVANRPILLGVSRKSFIGKILGSDKMADRSWPTVAITAYAAEKGIALHRVHEVKGNLESLRMMEAILAGT